MRILLLCYEYPPIGGGGGVAASRYAEAWAARGHEVTVITSRAPGLAAREMVDGVEVVRTATIGRRDRATATLVSLLAYKLTAVLHVLRHRRAYAACDVINTHFSLPTGPVGCIVSRLLGVPNVLTIIGGDIYDPTKRSSPHCRPLLRAVNRWTMRCASRIVAISSDTRDRAVEHYGITRPIPVINYGFTPCRPAPASDLPSLPDGRFRLVSVGRLVERKGFDDLIRAVARLPDDVDLVLVGDGPLEGRLGRLAADLGVTDRVHLLGFRPREAVARLLRESDCFVLSSLHEGLGIVVQEAMDAGLPVVATNNGGQVDLVEEPRNGLLVEPGRPEELVEAIRTVHADRGLAAEMGRNNLEDIAALAMDRNCIEYLDLFAEVTGRAPAPTAPRHEQKPVSAGS
ncbi:MAG: glycosyltransferase [Planctomycetota bacterium]